MSSSQYITVRETSQILGVSEKKVMDLIESKELQAYRIANKFLRLKRNEVFSLRNTGNVSQDNSVYAYTTREKVSDFFYFNDFYLIAFMIITGLLYLILFT